MISGLKNIYAAPLKEREQINPVEKTFGSIQNWKK